ncbi:hypothetical protein F5Y19DRAFT_480773 [Xylariaceae sp. FL1651]|nr:hypothetical protein F5Y19DRAFT_480773 [Xylariaceae sp. FL1651]
MSPSNNSLILDNRTIDMAQGDAPSFAEETDTEGIPEQVSRGEDDGGSQAFQLINVRENGNISYVDLDSLEQYLDAAPDKAEALETIVTDISVLVEKEECFKEWTSDVYDLVARKQYWEGGRHATLRAWQADHQLFSDTAKQGRAIRNKRKSAIDSLVASGVSGPRFEHMVRHSSRTFIEAVRKQVDMHGFSYPLVCALANVKAYHRLKAGGRGTRGAHTQTCDVADLDGVTYRVLSPAELKLVRTKVGAHGFLQEAHAGDELVLDKDFDEATSSFVVGSGGFAQPSKYGKVQPKITSEDSEEEELPAKRTKKKPDNFDIYRFPYITECACPEDVPQAMRSSLDRLVPSCGYSAVTAILPDVLKSCDKLCARHCQLTLVKALGRDHLVHKTDRESLQAEVRELVPKLERFVQENGNLKAKFDSYKKSIGFSWDLVESTAVPNAGPGPGPNGRSSARAGRSKRKRGGK